LPGTPRTDPYVSTLPHTAPTSGRTPGARACSLPHTSQSDLRAFPARCPGHRRLTGVSLGRTPSLHKLRRLVVFVRSLHRYYGSVRLPNTVHTGITDLPSPAVPPTIRADGAGVSRFSSMKLHVRRVPVTPPGPTATRLSRRSRFCHPLGTTKAAPGNRFFRSSIARLALLCQRFASLLPGLDA